MFQGKRAMTNRVIMTSHAKDRGSTNQQPLLRHRCPTGAAQATARRHGKSEERTETKWKSLSFSLRSRDSRLSIYASSDSTRPVTIELSAGRLCCVLSFLLFVQSACCHRWIVHHNPCAARTYSQPSDGEVICEVAKKPKVLSSPST